MNPRTGAIIAQRTNLGPVWYGRYNLVATDQGAWYSGGGGANGAWLHFFSYPELQVFQVTAAIGFLWLHATGTRSSPASEEPDGQYARRWDRTVLRVACVQSASATRRPRVPGWSYPLGLDSRGRLIFAVIGGGTAIPESRHTCHIRTDTPVLAMRKPPAVSSMRPYIWIFHAFRLRPHECLAVGAAGEQTTGSSHFYTVRWNTALTWHRDDPPSTTPGSFTSVSCTGSSYCTSVGFDWPHKYQGSSPIAEVWHSSSWGRLMSPLGDESGGTSSARSTVPAGIAALRPSLSTWRD